MNKCEDTTTYDDEVADIKYQLKLFSRQWFLIGFLTGIIAFIVIYVLFFKFCDLVMYFRALYTYFFFKKH